MPGAVMYRKIIIIAIALAMLALGVVYYVADPSRSSFFPRCNFLLLTGYKCPGCGSQRFVHALLHGDVAAALRYNALLFVAIPWIIVWLYAELRRTRYPRLYARLFSPVAIWISLAVVLLWWLLRNIFGW